MNPAAFVFFVKRLKFSFQLVDDLPIEEIDDTVGVGRVMLRVCHHDDRSPFGIQLTE